MTPCPAATLHADDFQADLASWTTGGAVVTRETTNGPQGTGDAFLRATPGFSNLATHNSSPAWTGNFSAVGAAEVTADLMAAVGSDPLSIRLVLFGPGLNPNTSPRWTSTIAAEVPADGLWRNYSFSLAESDLTRVVGLDTYANLMAGVLRVMVRHDTGTPSAGGAPVAGDLGIDNITLKTAALPGDFNLDGSVDGADFLAWQRGDSPAPFSQGDLLVWQNHYGTPLTGQLAGAVPEPSQGWASFSLLLTIFARNRGGGDKRRGQFALRPTASC